MFQAVKINLHVVTLCLCLLPPMPAVSHDTCPVPADLGAVRRVVDSHVCTDEYEKALALHEEVTGRKGILQLWDGTPFVVNVSSLFGNADELLAMVEDEADRIKHVLGYRIVVPGNVIPLPRVRSKAHYEDVFQDILPPPQQVHILCCEENIEFSGFAGTADRLVVLNRDQELAAGAIIHELYHLLGFGHPGESVGVPMSNTMMWNAMSVSTGQDLAGLACIYDDAPTLDQPDPGPIQCPISVETVEEFDWDAWQTELDETLRQAELERERAMRELEEGLNIADEFPILAPTTPPDTSDRVDLGQWNWLYDLPGGIPQATLDDLYALAENCRTSEQAGWPVTWGHASPEMCEDLGDLYP